MGRAYASRAFVAIFTALLLTPTGVGTTGFAQAAKASVETRAAAVDRVLADYREEQAKREPEAASLNGDKRYADQLSDFSASAANSRIERGQTYILRLSEIDNAGLPDKTRAASTALLNRLIEEQSGERAKPWQMPLDQFSGLHTQLLALAEKLPFDSVKDYDDYISRLRKIPRAFSQIMTNIQLGADSGRALPSTGIEKVVAQVKPIVAQPAEASPFAAPLKRFPASIAAAERQRISADLLDAIATDVIPSYQRVGRFISAHASPASDTLTPQRPAASFTIRTTSIASPSPTGTILRSISW